jgi:hypothetical protein
MSLVFPATLKSTFVKAGKLPRDARRFKEILVVLEFAVPKGT